MYGVTHLPGSLPSNSDYCDFIQLLNSKDTILPKVRRISPTTNQVLCPGVPGAFILPNDDEYQVTIGLTMGEIPPVLTKLLLIGYVSVYNVDNRHCE